VGAIAIDLGGSYVKLVGMWSNAQVRPIDGLWLAGGACVCAGYTGDFALKLVITIAMVVAC